MAVHLDLNTRVIPENHTVVVARPGADYHLAPTFSERNLVGPDLPSLDWDPADSATLALQKLKRSFAVRTWHRSGRRIDLLPVGDLAAYEGIGETQSNRQLRRVVEYYFRTAKPRDLVIIPPRRFSDDALIGEYVDEAIENYEVDAYGEDALSGRRVAWLGRIPKNKLPGRVLDALSKPSALVLAPRGFLPAVYQTAYGSYTIKGQYTSEFSVASAQYTIKEDFNLVGFLNFVAYNYREIERHTGGVLRIAPAAFSELGEYAPEMTSDINSPGALTLSSTFLIPLVAAAMFVLAVTVGPDAFAEVQNGTLTIGNSAAPDDPCSLPVREQIYGQMILLGFDGWAEACEVARKAAEGAGIKSQVEVR